MIDTNELTQVERTALLLDLIRERAGTFLAPDDLAGLRGMALMPFCSEKPIPPGVVQHVGVYAQRTFKPYRFLILEPYYDFTAPVEEMREQYTEPVARRWWQWRKPRERVLERIRYFNRTTRDVLMQRGRWTVNVIMVGAAIQFQGIGSINGSAFGPDSQLDFNGITCQMGQLLHMQVSHNAPAPVPFCGLFLGKVPTPKLAAVDSEEC